jgi:hypothetical protein
LLNCELVQIDIFDAPITHHRKNSSPFGLQK